VAQKEKLIMIGGILTDPKFKPPPRRRGKVAASAREQNPEWPKMTAARFSRLPGHEKTAVYFATSLSRIWQVRWHNDARETLSWFADQLSIRDGARRRGELS